MADLSSNVSIINLNISRPNIAIHSETLAVDFFLIIKLYAA